MLQIVIWGMAIMLVVKALDVWHQELIASKAGHGSAGIALLAVVLAFCGAGALVFLANEQVKQTPSVPSMPNLGTP